MMEAVVALLGLAVVHLLAVASPGPSTVLVVQTAAVSGRRGGLATAFAMMLGALAWAMAALWGLQALFAKFAWLYAFFRVAGGLVTDVNSRLPVQIERTRERAILAGDNSALMRLTLAQTVQGVQRGDRIVTSGHGGSFPLGIPVGEVVQAGDGTSVKVRPFADFSRLEFVRVVDYGVTGLVGGGSGPPATPLPPAGPRGR